MVDIPAWGQVVWGLTKFHTGLTRPMYMAVVTQAYYWAVDFVMPVPLRCLAGIYLRPFAKDLGLIQSHSPAPTGLKIKVAYEIKVYPKGIYIEYPP